MKSAAACADSGRADRGRGRAVAWLAAGLLALAPGAPGAEPEPPTLAELMRGMASSQGVTTRFHETKRIALLAAPLESRGVMYFAPPDRLARFTFEPARSSLVIDGDRLVFREDDGERYDLSTNPMARAFVDNFIVLFNGDLERLEALYRTELTGEREGWTLRLEPRAATLRAVIEDVTLRGDTGGIREMTIRNVDGDATDTQLETTAQRAFSAAELERLFDEQRPLPDALHATGAP